MFQAARTRFFESGKPFRFVLAGGLNTVFGLSIYPIILLSLPYFKEHYLIALLIAQALSLCFAFVTYKFTVFRTKHGALREFGRFVPFYLISYAINFAVLPILVGVVGLDPVVAQVGFSLIMMVGSYFWHNNITFTSSGKTHGV